jgi:O-antigen ligase
VALVLVVIAALIDDATVAWLLFPIILLSLIYAAWRAPLRDSLTVLALCAFTLDYPIEWMADGLYQSPFFYVGYVMLAHLNNLTGIRALSFSGTDIILVILICVARIRESRGSMLDRAGRIPTPKPMVQLAKLSLAGAFFVWAVGMVTGGDFGKSLWQVEKVVYLPILFLLWHLALRGPQDNAQLAKALVGGAMVKALWAIYIVQTVIPPVDPSTGIAQLAYAVGHSDSLLFACALVTLLLLLLEGVGGRPLRRRILMILPILIWGMVANNRRLVWVHVGMILLTLYVVSPDNAIKLRIRRSVYPLMGAFAVYLMVGWDNQFSRIFKPVRIIRSVVEPSSDGSTMWRELENYNLVRTIEQSPIFGQGYGHRWIEEIPMPVVYYDLEYYLPHNSILGLLSSAGIVGYTLITLFWAGGVYFAMRAYHAASTPNERVPAILAVGAVVMYQVQAFGDLGLGCWMGVHIMAPLLAMAGKLAVANGAWVDGPEQA